MYPNLKLQLWRSGIRQNRLAKTLGVDETLFSKIVNGFREPSSDLRQRIATALECDAAWLFASSEPADLHHKQAASAAAANGSKPDGV
jgi:transcriptional regulator with XRE-family HTH domain